MPRFSELLKRYLEGLPPGDAVEAALLDALREKGYADFDVLRVESVLDLVLVNEEPLHVGSGVEPLGALVDLGVVRVRRRLPNGEVVEEPVIPGSSLKGVLRSYVEAYASAMGLLEPLMEVGGERLVCTGEGLSEVESFLRKRLPALLQEGRVEGDTLDRLFEACLASPVVGLFGAPWLASHLYVSSARPSSYSLGVSTHVSIDRFTGSQASGLLYAMEYVEPGYEWRLRMRVFNVTPGDDRWELLRLMFRLLEEGLRVGRRVSAGMGLVRLDAGASRARVLKVGAKGLEAREMSLREWLGGGW